MRCALAHGRGLEDFMRAWNMLEAHNLLPAAGGLRDQHPKFLHACEIASAERAAIELEGMPSQSPSSKREPAPPTPAPKGGVGSDGVVRGGFPAPGA